MDSSPSAILTAFAVAPSALLGEGGQSRVYALDAARVLRVMRRPADVPALERTRALLTQIDGRLPVATSLIEEIDPDGRYTIERRLAGRSMLARLPGLAGAARRTAFANFLAAADLIGHLTLPERPYGQMLAGECLTAATWPGYFAASLDHWLQRNDATIAASVGDPADIRARTLALMEGLPERPAKALIHGDYFPGNVLLDERLAVSGLVDFSVFTLVGDPLYDPITAAIFLEMIDEASEADVAMAKQAVRTRHGEAIVPRARFYRAYAAVLMANPANAAAPYPKLYQWSLANLRALAADRLDF